MIVLLLETCYMYNNNGNICPVPLLTCIPGLSWQNHQRLENHQLENAGLWNLLVLQNEKLRLREGKGCV